MKFDRKSHRKRVVPVPTSRATFSIKGVVDGGVHVAIGDFWLYDGYPSEVPFRVPQNFAAYRVRVDRSPRNPDNRSIEFQFAQMVIDSIPRQVWDACIAALACGEDGEQAAREIYDRWRRGEEP